MKLRLVEGAYKEGKTKTRINDNEKIEIINFFDLYKAKLHSNI